MFFDFESRNFDTPTVRSAISWREQALVSLFGHILLALLVVLVPRLSFFEKFEEERLERLAEQAELREQQRMAALSQEPNAFIYVAPRIEAEVPVTPRQDAPLSDRDRVAQSPLRTLDPETRLPVAEGTSPELSVLDNPDKEPDPLAPLDLEGKVEEGNVEEGDVEGEEAEFSENQLVDATLGNGERVESLDEPAEFPGVFDRELLTDGQFSDSSLSLPGARLGDPDESTERPDLRADGLLSDADRGLQRSLQRRTFGNTSGDAGRYSSDIDFDSKGADFGPWLSRFRAQIYRNWSVPYRAWIDSGHVVLTFNIDRSGRMTGLTVLEPSRVEPFNHSAANALRMSNPTQPLPSDYPDNSVFFTVTFYFNERPPYR